MKRLKKPIAVVCIMLVLTLPTLSTSSAVGLYATSIMATDISANSPSQSQAKLDEVGWPLAVLAGVGLAVVFAVGVVDGWNSINTALTVNPRGLEDVNYDKNDFSKFDS
jgi:hypothetical protein